MVDVSLRVGKSLFEGSLPLLSSILDPQHLSPSYLVTKRGQQSSRNGALFGAGGQHFYSMPLPRTHKRTIAASRPGGQWRR